MGSAAARVRALLLLLLRHPHQLAHLGSSLCHRPRSPPRGATLMAVRLLPSLSRLSSCRRHRSYRLLLFFGWYSWVLVLPVCLRAHLCFDAGHARAARSSPLPRSSAAARVRALLLLLLRHPHQSAHLGSTLRHRPRSPPRGATLMAVRLLPSLSRLSSCRRHRSYRLLLFF